MNNKIHEKGNRDKPLTKKQKTNNTEKSKTQASNTIKSLVNKITDTKVDR